VGAGSPARHRFTFLYREENQGALAIPPLEVEIT
jgi:hypothetical protein